MHSQSPQTEVAGSAAGRESKRRPADELTAQIRRDTSQWRVACPALVVFLLVAGVGVLLGVAAFSVAGGHQGWPTTVVKTSTGWRLSSPEGLMQDSPALNDHYLVWSNGGCLELFDLRNGRTKVLESPAADDGGGFSGVISDRYVAWVGGRDAGGEIHVYDLAKRRSFTVGDVRDLAGTIALSGTVLYWDSQEATAEHPNRMVIHARDLASGRTLTVVAGDVLLREAAGDLVMWTQAFGKKASDTRTVVEDLDSGRLWRLRLTAGLTDVWGCRLAGHCVVWLTVVRRAGTNAVSMRIDALDLTSGKRRVVAKGPKVFGLAVSDGRILWANRSRPESGPLFMQAAEGGPIVSLKIGTLPVASGDIFAWAQARAGGRPPEVVIMRTGK